MGQTVVEKISQAHLAEGPKRPLRTGDFVAIRPHRVMTHDNTSAVMKKFQTIGAKKLQNPKQLVFALDHDIQNKDDSNLHKYQAIEGFAKYHGVDFYPAGSGIGHQIMVERGYVLPGSFVVASDSHSNMYGALGAVGTPIVRTDAAAAWATGDFWWQIPRSIQVVLEGTLPAGTTGKDVIITLCGLYTTTKSSTRPSNSAVRAWPAFPWTLAFPSPTCPPSGDRWWAGFPWMRSPSSISRE
jgi:homoaconitate hydratase